MGKNDVSDDDKRLFRQATKGTRPLKTGKKIASLPMLTPLPSSKALNPVQEPCAASLHLSSTYFEKVYADSLLSFCQASVAQKRWYSLKQGRIPWQSKLDLHGLRVDEAEVIFSRFILEAQKKRHGAVFIIHGKGGVHNEAPVLKNLVNHWLRQIPFVLAFHSALSHEGGTGALYVLLQRSKT